MKSIAIVGVGYVGLHLAVEFGKYRPTIGFDINNDLIDKLRDGHDSTREISTEDLKAATFLKYSCSLDDLREAQIFIITVPTPVDEHNRPDLSILMKSSEMVGLVLKKGDIVIYESTVYPGVTEDECIPVLTRTSGLKFNDDFFCGYSPERINPGDRNHRLTDICKVTSGSTLAVSQEINALYSEIIKAGTYMAPSIRVAEAAKIIENSQRDINIAFINEISRIFHLMNIDTHEVLKTARTKWNFVSFEPGLVGGHCISVDPHYLVHKARELGYSPEIILTGRRINDSMGQYIASQVVKLMTRKNILLSGATILILGFTYKENCSDIRNSKVIDIVNELSDFGCAVNIVDPWADPQKVRDEYGIYLKSIGELKTSDERTIIENYDAVIIAVAHRDFQSYDFSAMSASNKVIYDVKGILAQDMVDGRL